MRPEQLPSVRLIMCGTEVQDTPAGLRRSIPKQDRVHDSLSDPTRLRIGHAAPGDPWRPSRPSVHVLGSGVASGDRARGDWSLPEDAGSGREGIKCSVGFQAGESMATSPKHARFGCIYRPGERYAQ